MLTAPVHALNHSEEPKTRAPVSAPDYVFLHIILIPAVLAATAWCVQYGPLDMSLAERLWHPVTAPTPLDHSVWLDVIGHQAARAIPIFIGVFAFIGGLLPSLRPWRAILLTLAGCMVVGPVLINAMKNFTSQHCPAQIREFGGIVSYAVDRSAPFWAASRAAAGRCLPSGHAGGGYALLALYFAGWAAGRPAWRWSGLAVGVMAGVLFSVVRMMQGAHFASATLWSATIDWTVCAVAFAPLLCRRQKASDSVP